MTCLAVHSSMFAAGLESGLIGMTCFAGLVACELRRLRCDFRDGVSAVMAIFAEALGNPGGADNDESRYSDGKDASDAQ